MNQAYQEKQRVALSRAMDWADAHRGNPVKAALEYLRRAQYAEAANLLRCEFDKSPRTREHLARIANMITPCGMIAEAIDALHRIDGGIEDYYAHPPADEDIGSRVSITTPNAELKHGGE